MRSGHCWGSAGRRWLRRMTGCTPVHGNIQNATAKAWRASSELGYRQNRHQIWCSWVSTGRACFGLGQRVTLQKVASEPVVWSPWDKVNDGYGVLGVGATATGPNRFHVF